MIKWMKGDKYYVQTDTHTICKVTSGGKVSFELWKKGNFNTSELIERFDNAEDARGYYAEKIEAEKVPQLFNLF